MFALLSTEYEIYVHICLEKKNLFKKYLITKGHSAALGIF